MTTRPTDTLRAEWAERGYVITDADLATAKRHLAAKPGITDDQHEGNLAWLDRFDRDVDTA